MVREIKAANFENPELGAPQFLDFFHLSEEQQKDLQEQIQKTQGLVRIFVHPYYDIYTPPPPGKETDQRYSQRIADGLRRINSINADAKPPVMIMEEQVSIDKTRNFLQGSLLAGEKFLFIPTERGYHTPVPFGQFDDYDYDDSHEVKQAYRNWFLKSWEELRKRLKDSGVKKILIGGMYLWSDGRGGAWTGGRESIGCLGGAIKQLGDDFEIQISNFSNPDSRKEILELGTDFKKYL